ncbi:MAG: hypothetical protein K2W81_13700 [Sphingomonas sp.]|uniref:hypothetical protein n=1 Tax=Sphingomonas sp. TaxID=28214 RepID=UPI0025F98850|nr:hypothetical protein [Sphingomonas sp.]MBY0285000.1 hypothetical protein [Sphingomonas sp.]
MNDLISAPLVMAVVALLVLGGTAFTLTRPATSEAAIYRRRIAGTMLGAGAIILGGFAYALSSWGQGR